MATEIKTYTPNPRDLLMEIVQPILPKDSLFQILRKKDTASELERMKRAVLSGEVTLDTILTHISTVVKPVLPQLLKLEIPDHPIELNSPASLLNAELARCFSPDSEIPPLLRFHAFRKRLISEQPQKRDFPIIFSSLAQQLFQHPEIYTDAYLTLEKQVLTPTPDIAITLGNPNVVYHEVINPSASLYALAFGGNDIKLVRKMVAELCTSKLKDPETLFNALKMVYEKAQYKEGAASISIGALLKLNNETNYVIGTQHARLCWIENGKVQTRPNIDSYIGKVKTSGIFVQNKQMQIGYNDAYPSSTSPLGLCTPALHKQLRYIYANLVMNSAAEVVNIMMNLAPPSNNSITNQLVGLIIYKPQA